MSPIEAQVHLNACLDGPVVCGVCGCSLDGMTESSRNHHVNRCLDQSDHFQTKKTKFSAPDLSDRTFSCFSCSKSLSGSVHARRKHIEQCSGLSSDLVLQLFPDNDFSESPSVFAKRGAPVSKQSAVERIQKKLDFVDKNIQSLLMLKRDLMRSLERAAALGEQVSSSQSSIPVKLEECYEQAQQIPSEPKPRLPSSRIGRAYGRLVSAGKKAPDSTKHVSLGKASGNPCQCADFDSMSDKELKVLSDNFVD
jgi:hypothetical protein